MFVEFLEWYDIFSGHLQSNYKICGAALAHVVRYFLHLDDLDGGETVDDENDESGKRFRSSELLTREQARRRAAGGNDKEAMIGFWGKAVSDRSTIVKKAKNEARKSGVVATTQGTSVDKIKDERVIYTGGEIAHDLLLDA